MHIGVDFDNTIVCCDPLFYQAAKARNLIPASVGMDKTDVRDYLRRNGQEPAWTELQGTVYGDLLREARPFPGVIEFFSGCVKNKIPVSIISHKTKKPFLGEPHDLHQAARGWLEANGFFTSVGLPPASVYFEVTKDAKLGRIAQAKCTHFIDDLPEFLTEISFPHGVERMLFDPMRKIRTMKSMISFASWADIGNYLWKK